MPSQKQKIIETYKNKETVDVFDKERSKHAFQRYKHKIEANFLKKTINSVKSDNIKILDVACGTGRMLPEVFFTGKRVEYVGFDSSKEMTIHLQKKAKKLGINKNIKIKIGDALKIPFKDNEFDVVFSYHLLWHLPKEEQEKVIKEMLRVCKKDGFIVFDILNEEFIWEKIKDFLGKKRTKEIYKLKISDAMNMVKLNKLEFDKLNDFPIKNDILYSISNIINKIRKIAPENLYHMIYVRVKK